MELKNFYRLVFTNSQEFFIESGVEDTEVFLKELEGKGLFKSGTGYVVLQIKGNPESDQILIRSDKLFSVQKAREGIVGAQTKLWRLL